MSASSPTVAAPPPSAASPTSFADLTRRQTIFTIAGMMLTLLLAAMDQTIVGVAMPRVVASLDGFDRYPWVTTAYLLTSTVAVPVFARFSDLFGRKWLYLSGVVIFVGSSWLCGAAGQMPVPLDGMNQLIVARGLQGIGGGAIMGLTFTIIGDLFAPAERGRFQGLFGAMFGLASVVGPLAGGWITDHLSWRWAFYVNAPLGLLAIAVLYVTFPHVKPIGGRRSIDYAGLVTLVCWIVPLLLALSSATERGWTDPAIMSLLAGAAVMLAAFLFVEARADHPLIPLTLFRIPTIALASIAVFLLGMGMFGMFIYLPLYLQAVLGMSAAASGSLFTPLIFSMIGSSIVVGQLISRSGRYKIFAVGGAAVSALGMFLLTRLGNDASALDIVQPLVILGLGFGAMQPIYALAVQNAAPPAEMGVATASSQFFRSIGSTLGVALFGTLLLGMYHAGLNAAIPPGTPESLTALFDNPIQLVESQAVVSAQLAKTPGGQALLGTLMAAVRGSLAQGMHVIFLGAAAVMALAFVLNLLLPEIPLRTKARIVPQE
ncbi:MAG: MDR family MFS transporter [Vicinamibacterales bacterium]